MCLQNITVPSAPPTAKPRYDGYLVVQVQASFGYYMYFESYN